MIGCDDSSSSSAEITKSSSWLCFTANSAGVVISTEVVENGTLSTPYPSLEYTTDGGKKWHEFKIEDTSVTLEKAGAKMYIRAIDKNDAFSDADESLNYRFISFTMTGSVAASGNVMSLVDKSCKSKVIPSRVCFSSLFDGCTGLTSAPILPATTLTYECYGGMFSNCTSLTKPPVLPASELAEGCYGQMFEGCTGLTTAPELKAVTLAKGCYTGMFINTGLTSAPELPAEAMVEECYYGMFKNCPALVAAPELKATNFATKCYSEMFMGCTSLNSITVHFTGWPDAGLHATDDWVKDITGTGAFNCPDGLAEEFGNNRIPTNFVKTPLP